MCWLDIKVGNCSSASLAGLKIQGNTLIKFLGDAAYGGFCADIWTLDLKDFDSRNLVELQWQKAEFQGIENYAYKVLLPDSKDEVSESEDYEDYEEEDNNINWEDGIPYRTIHGYGEFGDKLVLFAGVAPGNGISHVTIGDLVMLNIAYTKNNNYKIYHWILPQVKGEFPNPRFGHATIQYAGNMIVFGGLWLDTFYGNHCYDNNVYILKSI